MLKLIPPWAGWLGAVLLLASAFGAGWSVNDWRRDAQLVDEISSARAAERAQWTTQIEEANAAQADAEARSAATATALWQYRQATDLLQAAIARTPVIEYREVPVREGESTVRVPVRGSRYRLCWAAAVTGSAADRAACAAADLHGAAAAADVPVADLVRPRDP